MNQLSVSIQTKFGKIRLSIYFKPQYNLGKNLSSYSANINIQLKVFNSHCLSKDMNLQASHQKTQNYTNEFKNSKIW